jgi:hypothetical protein
MKSLLLVPLALSLAGGCSLKKDEDDGASLTGVAKNTASLASQTAALAIIAVDPLSGGVADEYEAANAFAAAASGYFDDAGCVTTKVEPGAASSLVTLTFAKCDGPYGLADLTGEVQFRFMRAGSGLSIAIRSVSVIQLDEVAVDFTDTITVPSLLSPRTVTIQTKNTIAVDDLLFSLEGSGTLAWDQALCFTLSGSLTAVAGGKTLSANVNQLRRCAGACPNGEVSLTVTSGTPATIQVIFDGDHTAEINLTTPERMQSLPLPLICS